VLAVSLDGRLAPPAGGAAQLGGAGDRRALEEALAWADGCLIGANTLRLHGTTCLIRQSDLLEQRRREGRSLQPIALAVSRSGQLPADLPFFDQPLERWLLTSMLCHRGTAYQQELRASFARILPLQPWPELLLELASYGLGRLVLLGGAELAASLIAAGCVDGLQLTICPVLLGGGHSWIPAETLIHHGDPGWKLEQQRAMEGDELLLRYRRRLLH